MLSHSNPLEAGRNNAELEAELEKLPDLVAEALLNWRKMTLIREKEEALLHLRLRGEDFERTATEIKARINADEGRFKYSLDEAKAESEYTRLYERLMCQKRLANLRTAF